MTKKNYIPHTYIILFGIILMCGLLTCVVPVGYYSTRQIAYESGGETITKEVIDTESFQYLRDEEGEKVSLSAPLFVSEDGNTRLPVFNYLFQGLTSSSAVGVIAFMFVIGGVFGIILRTGAVNACINVLIRRMGKSQIIILPILCYVFSLTGAVFGMCEEAIPFCMITVPICVAMGYDSITAIMVTYVACQVGFATSWMNPFSLIIAQGIAELPVLSGIGFRLISWLVFTTATAVFSTIYAQKIKRNPESSVAWGTDNQYFRGNEGKKEGGDARLSPGHVLIVLTMVVTIAVVVWGITVKGYYLAELAVLFFMMGIISGIIAVIFKLDNMTLDDIANEFTAGAEKLLMGALVVGMAAGIISVLGGTDPTEPTIINTLLYNVGRLLQKIPSLLGVWVMYIFQAFFNFLVNSGSGQAGLTMPIMAPLSDILGISRQMAVLAFQYGDGFTNTIFPTSAPLIGVLSVANIKYGVWAKHHIKFQLCMASIAIVMLTVAFAIGYY